MSVLSLDHVCVSLGGAQVLTDASVSANAGEVVALLGANGAGKTTLIRTALGLLPPKSGRVLLNGADPAALRPRQRALAAAYMPQRPMAAWPLSVEAIVALGRFAHGAAPGRLALRDGAAVDAAIGACGLEHLRKRRMDALSGGERMRVHLARTIAQGAPILLLDEPTAGLDPAQALQAADILRREADAGALVMFATHDIGLAARLANRVILLHAGAVIASGPPAATLTSEALLTAYGRRGRLHAIGDALCPVFE